MDRRIMDAHIHLDHYQEQERNQILASACTAFIAVSYDLESSLKNLGFSQSDPRIKPAFGFHPEQKLLTSPEERTLFQWMEEHVNKMVAVGEIGLPYYSRQENPQLPMDEYVELLERFFQFAKKWDKPVVLHAVYEDADIVCDLLEKYELQAAHFHWFKGADNTIKRMIDNDYFISITPDVIYETEIQALVEEYPIAQMMVETDGPWPFEGRFKGQITHPNMIHDSIRKIAEIKNLALSTVYQQLYQNTVHFYKLG